MLPGAASNQGVASPAIRFGSGAWRRDATTEGRRSSVRGGAPRRACTARRFSYHGAADLLDPEGALALPQPRAGHLLRDRGTAAPVPARTKGGSTVGPRGDVL